MSMSFFYENYPAGCRGDGCRGDTRENSVSLDCSHQYTHYIHHEYIVDGHGQIGHQMLLSRVVYCMVVL